MRIPREISGISCEKSTLVLSIFGVTRRVAMY